MLSVWERTGCPDCRAIATFPVLYYASHCRDGQCTLCIPQHRVEHVFLRGSGDALDVELWLPMRRHSLTKLIATSAASG